MLLSMGLAAPLDDVSTVWGFIGSSGAILLGLTFPCLAYVKLRRTPTTRDSSVGQRKFVARSIIIVSVLLIPACFFVTVEETVASSPPAAI